MAGKCGTIFRVAARIAPTACNAITETAAGLLVALTEVAGLAPGTAVGTGRSVDIDITPPLETDCPRVWTVGARLTPVWGQEVPDAALDLTAVPTATWTNIAGFSFVAPETGVYRIAADVSGSGTYAAQTAYNRLISARMLVNGVPLPSSIRNVVQTNFSQAAAQSGGMNGSGTISTVLQLAAGDVVSVQGEHTGASGAPLTLFVGNPVASVLAWNKIAD